MESGVEALRRGGLVAGVVVGAVVGGRQEVGLLAGGRLEVGLMVGGRLEVGLGVGRLLGELRRLLVPDVLLGADGRGRGCLFKLR